MPNWCEGVLKIRGTYNDICYFFEQGVHCYEYSGLKDPEINSRAKTYYHSDFGMEVKLAHEAYIENTQRAFVLDSYISVYKPDVKDEVIIQCIVIKQAWCIHSEDFKNLSKKYNLDFRIYAYERGMEFNQEVEVINGQVTMDRTISFDDYEWECPNPRAGG